MDYDQLAVAIRRQLPPGPALAVIGSTTFHHPETEALCRLIAEELAELPELVVVTGGVSGVGETFARALLAARQAAGRDPRLFHLLPNGLSPAPTGTTLPAGNNMFERREIIVRVADAYLVIEGGPGTLHEATVAQACGAPLIPIARTRGHAALLHAQLTPHFTNDAVWATLASLAVPLDVVARAACAVVRRILRSPE